MLVHSLLRYAAGLRHVAWFPCRNPQHPPVVLVHGLLHRGVVMYDFARYLNRTGRTVYVYDYRTTRSKLGGHGQLLARELIELADGSPQLDFISDSSGELLSRRMSAGTNPKFDLITHSMGGLITRVALAELEAAGREEIVGRIVMLAPPHRGSAMARAWSEGFFLSPWLVRPLPELSDAPEAAVHQLPLPSGYEIGVIAAGRDRKVSLSSTHLDGETDHLVLDSGHSFMMNKKPIREAACRFLETGRFSVKK